MGCPINNISVMPSDLPEREKKNKMWKKWPYPNLASNEARPFLPLASDDRVNKSFNRSRKVTWFKQKFIEYNIYNTNILNWHQGSDNKLTIAFVKSSSRDS